MLPKSDQPTAEANVADQAARKAWQAPSVKIHEVSELTEASNNGNPDAGAGSS